MKRGGLEAGLAAVAERVGLELDGEQVELLVRYVGLLAGYGRANVVGSRDTGVLVRDHIADSLSCFKVGALREASSLADIGSGGGLPGIPLKIVRPELRVTLIESTGKKAAFLRRVVGELGLEGISVESGRVEEYGRGEGRGKYEVAVARAVASLPVLMEYGLPLVGEGGHMVCMKGRVVEEERRAGEVAARVLGGEFEEEIIVSEGERYRSLIVYRKTETTPEKYPRRVGMPVKRPLG